MPAQAPELASIAARDMARCLSRPDYQRWADQVRRTGGCAQPVILRGRVDYLDPLTRQLLHRYSTAREPGGVLRIACKTRRASRCPSCAETYRADTYQLIRAGLHGGKGVPAEVAAHPAVFVTLTAPSFGPVHARPGKTGADTACHPRRDAIPCPHGNVPSCAVRHAADDPLGTPLCPDCYDYTGSVLFNACAPELWRRFTLALRRRIARSAHLPLAKLSDHVIISFAKVAEYQRRGVVHLHAVIRFDGAGGPGSPPPPLATASLLADAVRHAASVVSVTVPAAATEPARVMRWGRQLDIRPITATGTLTDRAVAGYIAKYATKAAECTGTLDRPLRSPADLHALPISEHAKRLIAECLRLATCDELAPLRLDAWAHMLGFAGHFSTKSRQYSTTLGALRAARAEHNRQAHIVITGRFPLADDTIIVIARWQYVTTGQTLGEALVTAAITGQPMPPSLAHALSRRAT